MRLVGLEGRNTTAFAIYHFILIDSSTPNLPYLQVPLLLALALETIDKANVGWLDLVVNSFQAISVGLKRLLRFLFTYHLISVTTDRLFVECEKIVRLRRTSNYDKKDLLQALLNARGEGLHIG